MSLRLKEKRHQNTVASISPLAEKFDIVSNNHVSTGKCDFSVCDRKFSFWANLVKKKKKTNCQLKLKFGIPANWSMQNSMTLFLF